MNAYTSNAGKPELYLVFVFTFGDFMVQCSEWYNTSRGFEHFSFMMLPTTVWLIVFGLTFYFCRKIWHTWLNYSNNQINSLSTKTLRKVLRGIF